MGIQCFLLTQAPRIKVDLRRYSGSGKGVPCPLIPGEYSYHSKSNFLMEVEHPVREEGKYENWDELEGSIRPSKDDPRWPRACNCGYQFCEDEPWQMFTERMYTRSDNGALTTIRDAPAGALWYADWMMHEDENGVRRCWEWDNALTAPLMCKTPGGDWMVDGRASNCTMKEDGLHRCWVRHGDPPNIHVDKNGHTCAAGAGSIISGGWHGFLHNGYLVEC